MTVRIGFDVIGVGVGAMIFNEAGEVFLSQRGPLAKNERGTWEFPGGGVDYGERLEDAIQREIMEEYGMVIEITALLSVDDHILPAEGQHWVSPTYLARHISGEPRILEPGKCSAIGWFAIDAVTYAPLSIISAANVKSYKAKFAE